MSIRRAALAGAFLATLITVAMAAPAAADDALWKALRSGEHVALLRHALAPGTADPTEFALRDCATQRNLSDQGRGQAARIGDRFRANGIAVARVASSQWCRCLETARLLDLGPVEELPPLNSFFRRGERRNAQTQALQAWLGDQVLERPIVLVTHQVNITALTGIFPASGELVVLRRDSDGTLAVIGRLETE